MGPKMFDIKNMAFNMRNEIHLYVNILDLYIICMSKSYI